VFWHCRKSDEICSPFLLDEGDIDDVGVSIHKIVEYICNMIVVSIYIPTTSHTHTHTTNLLSIGERDQLSAQTSLRTMAAILNSSIYISTTIQIYYIHINCVAKFG
jgi:hypothetical protein